MIATVALLRHGGSHLIRPIVAALGYGIVEPGNFGAPLNEAVGPIIVFRRDPRNRVISKMRWRLAKLGLPDSDDDFRTAELIRADAVEMRMWADTWCNWPGTLSVRFEDVRADGPAQITRIAKHLGTECDSEALYADIYAKGRTYTGRHSDWRKSFGPYSAAAWNAHGGPDLVRVMGYE